MQNTSLKTQLGTTIASLRSEANMSQNSFALMVGVSRKYLIDIESGKANPTVDMLERIAGGLDTTVGQLFEGL
ncbi:helix-turn-helix domain-containing protein [Eggerthella sinensis]|uniref:helix-turn-helix domain-containing protein n=1 Tax=Eggerthella sinensis TaxID=242230 RepID=UPI001D06E72D|nr:helix-turn-helix transcriptional regulator [Eggerthella sinensis]MCB7038079.1 helix-turn-helix domain-containing protein [Eggerthella sinensis]